MLAIVFSVSHLLSTLGRTHWNQYNLVSGVGFAMSTRAASRMEEQMAALLEKMDQHNEQLQLFLTQQQAERVDVIALKQEETDGHIDGRP